MSRLKLTYLVILASLGVMALLRVGYAVVYWDYFGLLSFGALLTAFVQGLRFDLSILFTITFIPLLMLALPIRQLGAWWLRGWLFAYLLLLFGIVAVGIGDLLYFGYVKRHLSNELLVVMDDWMFVVKMALFEYAYLMIPALIALWGLYLLSRVLAKRADISRRSYVGFVVLFFVIALGIRGSVSTKSINVIDAFDSGDAREANLILNGAFTAYQYGRSSGNMNPPKFFDQAGLARVLGRSVDGYPFQKQAIARHKKNIIFVLLESWSAKYVDSVAGTHYGVTPNFDALAAKGWLFTRYYAAGQRSIQGIQASLTSIPPFASVPNIGMGLEVYNISKVAAIARSEGYETLFTQTSLRRSYRMDSIAEALGFSHYYAMEDMPNLLHYPDWESAIFGWDYEAYMLFFDKIEGLKKPFFGYLFTGTTHPPYTPLEARFTKYPHDPNGENGFLNTLYYADWSLGEFMKKAEQTPWYKDTIFIFTADHTLAAGRSTDFSDNFHIPLLIFDPSDETPKRDHRITSQMDIMPTLIELTGYSGTYSAYGHSLFDDRAEWKALINDGATIALVKEGGYLRHSLKKVLESSLPEDQKKGAEEELLATYQLVNTILKQNRWAKDDLSAAKLESAQNPASAPKVKP